MPLKKDAIKIVLFPLLAAASFIFGHYIQHNKTSNYSSVTSRLERKLHIQEQRVIKELETLSVLSEHNTYADLFNNHLNYYSELFEKHGLLFLIYENDTLKFWTDHSVAFENNFKNIVPTKLVNLKNRWFETFVKEEKSNNKKIFIGLLLIKNDYPTQNEYLENSFNKEFHVDEDIKISLPHPADIGTVHNYNGQHLFSIDIDESYSLDPFSYIIKIILNVLGIIFTFLALQHLYDKLKTKTGYYVSTLVFVSTVLILRYLSIILKFPEIFYESDLFDPQLYGDASSLWLSSLGDFLINSILITYAIYYTVQKYENNRAISLHSSMIKQAIALGLILFSYLISIVINSLIIGLILNSNISFNVNDIFSLNIYSYVAFTCVVCLLFSFYFIINKVNEFISSLHLKILQAITILIVSIICITLISHLTGELDEILFLWSTLLLTIMYILKNILATRHAFAGRVALLLVVSFYSAHMFMKFSEFKENNSRIILADEFSAEQDPIAENLFAELESKLQTDTSIAKILNDSNVVTKKFEETLIKKYFNGYWKKYEIKITAPDSENLFEKNFRRFSPTQNKDLYYTDDPSARTLFIARVPIDQKQHYEVAGFSLYITFNPKFSSEKIGFPELLVDKKKSIYHDLKKYSLAKYRNNQLTSFYGDYSYPSVYKQPSTEKFNYLFYEDNEGYSHLVYKSSENTFIILSKTILTSLNELTTFSFLFTLYSFLLLLLLFIYQLSTGFNFSSISFKNKIQYCLILIIFLSTLLFSGTSIFYIKKQYEEKNKKNIREKIAAVSEDMRQELEEKKDFLLDPTGSALQNASDLFSTDINLYDPAGNLISSSIPKLFNEGLLSHKMCPEAYTQLCMNEKNEFAHDEKIGNLDYLSAYVPFKNHEGSLLGYINMPYFSKQSDLEQEISSFTATIINIYVLLFLLSAMIAILISRYITYPLSIIQKKMRKTEFGKPNEPIRWKNNDEIGSLVNEYNRMIEELTKSAELLAKSERESAWREMAKQVAHEIKNPLTPMKLSIQHFEKTWHERDSDNHKKLKRFTETLIEQIDSLTTIANEFSNFARMPKSNFEKVNIQNVILNVIDLHKNLPNTIIKYSSDKNRKASVYCDKEQLLRALNNLIKNAIQAIPEYTAGRIEVALSKQGGSYLISIKDNGTGISEELKEKIFVPNFTTKTGGTGLGLAMTKNTIESFNGKIWFETKENEGTTFFILLPEDKP